MKHPHHLCCSHAITLSSSLPPQSHRVAERRTLTRRHTFVRSPQWRLPVVLWCVLCIVLGGGGWSRMMMIHTSQAFVVIRPSPPPPLLQQQRISPLHWNTGSTITSRTTSSTTRTSSTTALDVWWYGGNENVESNVMMNTGEDNADSCELVAVRIERTASNSRRILGDITIAAPIQDVWAILTDYNRLSIHVPNLVESNIERSLSPGMNGDGQYQCRLYQKGAQKIIGFEFGASVTMDMKEIITQRRSSSSSSFSSSSSSSTTTSLPSAMTTLNLSKPPSTNASMEPILREERKITFKCVDSFFFREFDGEWKVQEYYNANSSNNNNNNIETVLSYVVDVRPKGPVPVAALEWRIREDVPTNLRAVKKAALHIQSDPILRSSSLLTTTTTTTTRNTNVPSLQPQSRAQSSSSSNTRIRSTNRLWTPPPIRASQSQLATATTSTPPPNTKASRFTTLARDARTKVQWLQEETMAAYLTNNNNNSNNNN